LAGLKLLSADVSPATLSYQVKGEIALEVGESGILLAGPKFKSPTLEITVTVS